jgi:hypothetical protein
LYRFISCGRGGEPIPTTAKKHGLPFMYNFPDHGSREQDLHPVVRHPEHGDGLQVL